jgi:AraC-like DNA-binding protein
VPETYVQLLYEYLEARGHVPEAVLGAPWPKPAAEGPGGVEVELWDRMLERAEAALADPLIGLHVGQTINPRHLGILGPVFASCSTLAAALQKLEQYQRLIFDVTHMSQRAGPGWVELVWDTRRETHPGRLVNETGFAVLIQFCRSLVRGTGNPLAVDFAHAGPADVRPYEHWFGCPVRFDQPEALVRVGLDLLASPLKSPDPALMLVLEQHADRLLAQMPQQEQIVEKVRKVIAHALREGEPDIERISAKLATSSRTLQRRLQQAGTGFREELNLVRYELALSYLRDPRLQIVEIALLLGYSEHSAFTRAFRERTGSTPHQFRARTTSSREVVRA